jgi:hypothetical protein
MHQSGEQLLALAARTSGAIAMRQQPDTLVGAIGAQQFAQADGVQTGDAAGFLVVACLAGGRADNIVATGAIAGGQNSQRAGYRAADQGKWQVDGLARAGRHTQAAAIAQTAIEFECGVVQSPGLSRANIDASAAGGGLDGGMYATRCIEFRQSDLTHG